MISQNSIHTRQCADLIISKSLIFIESIQPRSHLDDLTQNPVPSGRCIQPVLSFNIYVLFPSTLTTTARPRTRGLHHAAAASHQRTAPRAAPPLAVAPRVARRSRRLRDGHTHDDDHDLPHPKSSRYAGSEYSLTFCNLFAAAHHRYPCLLPPLPHYSNPESLMLISLSQPRTFRPALGSLHCTARCSVTA
jgi:hypothetical protein